MIIHKCDMCAKEIKRKECSKLVIRNEIDTDDIEELPRMKRIWDTYELCDDCAYALKAIVMEGCHEAKTT